LTVHDPELATKPDESAEAVIEQGQEVGKLARQMFPGGVAVESKDREEAIRTTRELIKNPEVPAVFEGAFEHRNVFVRVDIMHRRRDRRWRLIEVKSTTDAKDHHSDDIAIQYRVATCSGLDLGESCLAHVNREYVYEGGPIDVRSFFKIRNRTGRVERLQPKLVSEIRSQFRILQMPEAPCIPAGAQCSHPITCEFFAHCNQPVPDDHILRLPRIPASTISKLVAEGIRSIHDIPEHYPLPERLRRACASVRTGTFWFSPEIKNELKTLKYPLYYMDFESLNPAIPRFAGMRPFDHIPFQWSLHVQQQPGGFPEPFEFLADNKSDPRRLNVFDWRHAGVSLHTWIARK
jgi:hypothetical protein